MLFLKKLSIYLALILGFTLCLNGCKSTQGTSAGAQKTVSQQSLLWKMEGKGLQQPSYLYGTIHILPQKDFFVSPAIKEAFAATQQVILELDMDDPNMAMNMMKHAQMPDGKSLDKLLSPEDYQKLDQTCKKATGMGIGPFNTWQPILVSSLLLKEFLGENPASYEMEFTRMAAESKKEVLGLETIERQMQAMSTIPLEQQATYLSEQLNDLAKQKAQFFKMVELYKAQDLEALVKYIQQESGTIDFSPELLNRRNREWIEPMSKAAQAKATFFAVGAGHLGGPEGVLALLKRAGYKISPVL
jgi:uncharacterized protein